MGSFLAIAASTLSTACWTRSCCVLISISHAPRFSLMVTFGGFPVSDNSILLCLLSKLPLFELITDRESSFEMRTALTNSNGQWRMSFLQLLCMLFMRKAYLLLWQ